MTASRRIPRLIIASLGAGIGALAMAVALTQCAPASAQQVQTAQSVDTSRIVAAGGAVTETLYALGLKDRIVGVDSTSLHPPEALKDKANVGYVRALSAEGVLSLRPSVILSIPNAGPPDVLKLIKEAGVPYVELGDDASAEGVIGRIEQIGRMTGASDAAYPLAKDARGKFAALEQDRARVVKPKRILFVLALREGRPMVGGRNSSADAIIRLAGGVNAASAVEGYKPMTDEAVIAAAPDAILMMDRSGQHAVAADDLFHQPSFSATPAAAAKALIVMDGLYLLGFGPRTPDAARDLMLAIYPEMRSAKRADVRR